MAIVFDNTLTSGYTQAASASLSNNTTIVGNKPSALAENEYLLAVLTAGNTAGANSFTPPADFVQIFNNQANTTTGVHTYIGLKKATASEPATYTFGLASNSRDDLLTLIRVTGVDQLSPVAVAGASTDVNSVSPTSPSITTLNQNDIAVFVVSQLTGTGANQIDSGAPSGTTLVLSKVSRTGNSNAVGTGIAFQQYPTPQATGTKQWLNYVTSTSRATAISFALKELSAISIDSITPSSFNNTSTVTAVITGELASGAVDLIAGGVTVAQTVSSWSYNSGTGKTTVVINVVQGGVKFGAATIRYTSGGTVLNASVTLNPIAGNAAVNISSPSNAEGYIFNQVETGTYTNVDQIEHTDSPNTVVNPDGLITQTVIRNFNARARDSSDNTWSTFSAITPTGEVTPAITNINGGNPVIPGQAATWTATGFAPNAATLDGIACLSVSSLGFTPPGYADEANNPRPGNRLLAASEGPNTASATVPVGVIPGYKYQTLASVSAGLYSVVKDMDADIGDFVVYPDADGNNVTSAGELETNHEGSQVFWLIKGDTGYGLSYNVLTGPGGEIIEVVRSLTAKSLTMSGLTMRSLTARGL